MNHDAAATEAAAQTEALMAEAATTQAEGIQDQPAEGFDLGSMLMGEVENAPYFQYPGGRIDLPQWDPILHLGPFPVDLSPTKYVVWMVIAAVLVLLTFLLIGRAFRRLESDQAPSGFANAVEAMVVFFRDQVVRANIGKDGDRFAPFILTLFFFILYMNLLGLIPWGISSTASISVTLALAFLAFLWIEIAGFMKLGPAGYARTIFYAPSGLHPVGQALMLIIMTPVEALGKLTKPFALMIRLFANMTAGKILILALVGLIFVFADLAVGRWGIAGGAVGMAAAITLLKVFISFLQAFIFAMLTAVFIGLIRHAH